MSRINSSPEIAPIRSLDGMEALAAAALEEGYKFLERLIREWNDGSTRFDGPNEVLFGAYVDGKLVATSGLTQQGDRLGRVRASHQRVGSGRASTSRRAVPSGPGRYGSIRWPEWMPGRAMACR